MSNIAPVKWAQRADSIYLTISLSDVSDPVIDLTSNKLTFSGKSNGKQYELDLEFVSRSTVFERIFCCLNVFFCSVQGTGN